MRRINLHGVLPTLTLLVAVILITAGCTGDALDTNKQLSLLTTTT